MKNILIMLMLVSISLMVNGQRNIHLLHGYGGQPYEWDNYHAWLEAQNTISGSGISAHQIDYNNGGGLSSVTEPEGIILGSAVDSALNAEIDGEGFGGIIASVSAFSETFSDPNGIAIGQSMGGLVLREIDNLFGENAPFGGYITCGTPNQGLPMVDAMTAPFNVVSDVVIVNGISEVESTIQLWMETLAEGPYGSITTISNLDEYFINYAVVINFISDIFNGTVNLPTNLADFISGPLRRIMDQIDNPIDDIIDGDGALFDLPPNSDFINNINAFTTTMPTVGIWGNENEQAHYRLACGVIGLPDFTIGEISYEGSNNAPHNHPLYDNVNQSDFTGIKEIECIAAMASIAGVYESFSEFYYNLADLTTLFGLLFWLESEDSHVYAVGEAYERGRDLLTSQSEVDYLMLIRANEVSSITIDFNNLGIPIPPIVIPSLTLHPSDGLVPKWSQQLPNAIDNLEVEGVNHFEYFNHPNMTDELDFILGNTTAPHPFFKTIQ